jgi:hypothetical protein
MNHIRHGSKESYLSQGDNLVAELTAPSSVREGTVESEGDSEDRAPHLTPIDFDAYGFVPGEKASWRCSPNPCYGPDELGMLRGAVEDLVKGTERSDSAAHIWEVLLAWEQRLFRRNVQFLNAGVKGWNMAAGSAGTTGAALLQHQNSGKLFSSNVFGARHKKIVALLSREVPPCEVVAEDDQDTMDKEAAQEAVSYLKAFREQAKVRRHMADAASYLYTDGTAVSLVYTVADRRYGQEIDETGDPVPARREEVEIFGKLERKVPIMADSIEEMGWIRLSRERNRNELRGRYPWIKDKIAGGASKDAMGQLDRIARANVRLIVQSSSTDGEAYQQDTTESLYFFRPYQYEGIGDEQMRQMFYDEFPSGLEVWLAGGEIGLVREGSMDDHAAICHATPGDGQNRESIGTNYLPMQKQLNACISLAFRYYVAAIARRWAGEPVIDVEAINKQANDPAKVSPFDLQWCIQNNVDPSKVTFVENVAQPNDSLLQYIQLLMNGMPEAMDGGSPAVFGIEADAESKGTFGEARLDRDQALQVFSLPWGDMATQVACFSHQAIKSARDNRISDFSVGLPSERVRVNIGKLKGNVLVWSTSTEIPPTLAEQQAEIGQMLQAMGTVPFYAQILSDPRNLELLRRLPSLTGMKIPGLDDVERQIEDNQKLLASVPLPNPVIAQIQEQIQQIDQQAQQAAQTTPDPMQRQAIVQQAQQQVAQLTQALQQLPPLIPSIQPAQDSSQDHQIRAAIALSEMKSARGKAAQNGDDEQKKGFLNLALNWQAHAQMAQKLQPPPPVEMRASVTIDPTKLPPAAQAIAFERLGFQMPPVALQAQEQTHEITEDTEGINPETGVPTKRKISVVGKPLQ